ncbi:CPBP family intramembrane glutamic endopeptidase [Anaerococcus urinomassiliensis]|uniref:CPBP family intramembrane glutamic endopeptidase n=1 Tax=Anaerococcus urinomassiliensis TaxID=1745712 RepID=UPI0038B3F406
MDLLIKNIILNDILILDFKFYTSFNNISILRLIFSLIISIGEEFIFRFPIGQFEIVRGGLLLIVGSISFGIIHFYFSKYDGLSKIVIGLIFGTIILLTKNIYYSIITHITYNIAIELFGGINKNMN